MANGVHQPQEQPTEEEILAYLFPKSHKCPVCDKEFMDFAIKKSKLRSIGTDTDFLTTYKDIDPNHYEILFCAHCGYAALTNYFNVIVSRQQALIREKITPNYKPMEFPVPLSLEHVVQRYKQALACAVAMDAKPSIKAFINLKLAWVLRKTGRSKDLEIRFLKEALAGLKSAFTTERFPLGNMDESTAKYVIADLARRTGDFAEAMRWVGDLIISKSIPGSLKERAANLKDMIRDGIAT